MQLKKFTLLFYNYQFFFDFITLYAVEKLFMLDRGLNLTQIGLLLFLWSAMTMVLEIPTGAIADHVSRRKLLISSGFFFSICYSIWAFSSSFWLFLLGFLFRTVGSTVASGTLQAYVYDYLDKHKQTHLFEKIWGRGNALRTLGIGAAVLLGGFLSQVSYQLPAIISALSILTISLTAIFMPEIPIRTKVEETDHFGFIKDAFKVIKNNRNLLHIVIFAGVTMAVFGSLEEYNDIYLKFLGYPNYIIGIIFAIATVAQSIASMLAHRFKDSTWKTLNLVTLIGFLILIAAARFRHPFMAAGILFLGVLMEFSRVLMEGVIQREVPPDKRATISSISTFIHNLIPFQLAFGVIANTFDIRLSYAFLAATILIYLLSLPLLTRRHRS